MFENVEGLCIFFVFLVVDCFLLGVVELFWIVVGVI